MKLYEVKSKRNIILVCGNIACGKGTYCKTKYPGYVHIPVSDVVKTLSKHSERSELGKTAHLDNLIVKELITQINQYDHVVVDGIRQLSILRGLERQYGTQINKIVWLDVPEDIRRTRFAQRGDTKDNLDYDAALDSDRNLGIDQVEEYIRGKHHVEPY